MKQFGLRARAVFDRIFPERQIYLRSCGSVRGVLIAPSHQVLAALCALGVAGWCAYATTNILSEGEQRLAYIAGVAREQAKYDRWLNEARAQAAAAHALVERRVHQLDRMTRRLENRHEVLRTLLEYAGGSSLPRPMTQTAQADEASIVMTSSFEDDVPPPVRLESPAQQQVTTVSLTSDTPFAAGNNEGPGELLQGVLTTPPSQPTSPDFAAYLRDPRLADRVTLVAERIASARRMQ